MKRFYPEKIYVEAGTEGAVLVENIIARCPGVAVETVSDVKQFIRRYRAQHPPACFEKTSLLLCKNRGRFFEACPGTKSPYLCCGYKILHTGSGCPLDCSYCVLQAYLNNPFITLFTNLEDMAAEIAAAPALNSGKTVRIGTGEYMDSLALEHLTGFTQYIQPFLQERNRVVLELKTKTTHIDALLRLDHNAGYIVSWSLNAADIAQKEEHPAPDIRQRIYAAEKLTAAGYRVGFHFDPVILYNGWQEGYRKTIELLAAHIPPSSCAWISIGLLRYMPALKTAACRRFPHSPIYAQEFVPGLDGKMRYLQDMRIEMYANMISWLRDYSPDVFVYYCMEHPVVWKKTLGFAPASNAELKTLLDERAV